MKYTGLDGKQYSINFAYYQNNSNISRKSKYHLMARELIRDMFPANPIFEEVTVPGTRMHIDFFLPTQYMIVEVHGEQHYKDNSFFYESVADFISAKQRDKSKQEWCEINNLKYIELPYKETIDEWRKRLS